MRKEIARDAAGNPVRNDDGSLREHYVFEESDKDENGELHVVATGPIGGLIELADGTVYDVTDHFIAVKPEHKDELHAAILREHHAAGRFLDVS